MSWVLSCINAVKSAYMVSWVVGRKQTQSFSLETFLSNIQFVASSFRHYLLLLMPRKWRWWQKPQRLSHFQKKKLKGHNTSERKMRSSALRTRLQGFWIMSVSIFYLWNYTTWDNECELGMGIDSGNAQSDSKVLELPQCPKGTSAPLLNNRFVFTHHF